MKMNAEKKKTGAGLIMMALGILILLAGIVMTLLQRTGIFEYVLPAPAPSDGAPVRSQLEDLSGMLTEYEWSAALRTQNVSTSVPETGKVISATLYAVSEGYFDLHHETLREGRYITGEDIRNSRKAAVISRSCADTLFQGLDPLGRVFSCNDLELEIVGVTEKGFRPGETTDAIVWIPVSLADTEDRQGISTLEIRVFSDSQMQSVILKNLLAQWSAGGTAYDYARLRLAAFMPLWLLGIAAGLLLLRRLVQGIVRKEKQLYLGVRKRLENRYPGQLKGAILGSVLFGTAIAALLPLCVYLWLACLMMPMYTFTEWIPEALADPAAVLRTAKALLAGAASSALYRSSGASAFSLYSAWITTGALLFTAGLCSRLLSVRTVKNRDAGSFL